VQTGRLALDLEEAMWADMDGATALLFEMVERDVSALRRSIARAAKIADRAGNIRGNALSTP